MFEERVEMLASLMSKLGGEMDAANSRFTNDEVRFLASLCLQELEEVETKLRRELRTAVAIITVSRRSNPAVVVVDSELVEE